MTMVRFVGAVDLLSDGKVVGGHGFKGNEGWPKIERGAYRLGANTTVQALVIANATPVKVFALECEHPVMLKIGGGTTSTTLFGVDGFILVDCNAKTISCKNVTSTYGSGNGIRYVACGG